MQSVFTGPVYVVRDNIDTDQIIPAQYLNLVPTIEDEYVKLGSYAMCGLPESLYPDALREGRQAGQRISDRGGRAEFRLRQFARARADRAGFGGLQGRAGGEFCADFFPQLRGDGRTCIRANATDRLCDILKTGDVVTVDLDAATVTVKANGQGVFVQAAGRRAAGGGRGRVVQLRAADGDDFEVNRGGSHDVWAKPVNAPELNLLPAPRSVRLRAGSFVFPARARLELDASLSEETAEAIAWRLQSAADEIGVRLPRAERGVRDEAGICAKRNPALQEQAYTLTIDGRGVEIEFHDDGGLRAGVATLRQLLREHGRRLPCLMIRDLARFSQTRRDAGHFARARAARGDIDGIGRAPRRFQDQRISTLHRTHVRLPQIQSGLAGLGRGDGSGNGEARRALPQAGNRTCAEPEFVRPSALLAGISAAEKTGGSRGAVAGRRRRVPAPSVHACAESSGHAAVFARALR